MDCFEALYVLVIFTGFMFLLGVVYPVAAVLSFPIYRLFGGKLDLWSYIKNL